MVVIAGVFVAAMIAVAWLGAAGFARLRAPLDRLHCVTFVNAGCGLALLAASLAAEGVSNRTVNILLVVTVNLFGGAAASHAIGRALRVRGSLPEID
ncbi:MAG: monovalent cation/H(+) antiporter subunit G [Janthinobacterium lividum]